MHLLSGRLNSRITSPILTSSHLSSWYGLRSSVRITRLGLIEFTGVEINENNQSPDLKFNASIFS